MAAWRVTGVGWRDGVAQLEWVGDGRNVVRRSPLQVGAELAFGFEGERRCVGFWRAGRRLGCSTRTVLAAGGRSGQCIDCQGMERANSVAADTRLDDPRPYNVYLAHHGSVIKVGITAVERGEARLLEQGALASVMISAGSLVGARRVEMTLGAALGLPDRVGVSRKRAARVQPGSAAERSTGLLGVVEQIGAMDWPEGQVRCEALVSDHVATYGLPDDGLRAEVAMTEPVGGGVIAGRIVCAIGSDLYVETPVGLLLLDTHLLAGWTLGRAPAGAEPTVPLEKLEPAPRRDDQEALF
ncbi:DUF2797 domain-containing protein [Kribbella sp. NPDC051718]|uniref:DUF2797 domain-containing protein n=1 Tax=Kribbella sp. NPDC051718 TaxID=3155168 RepID=UPI003436EB0C